MSQSASMFVKAALALVLLASWVQLALGAPTASLEKRDVFVPPVLYPHAGTVWTKGQRHNVTWDTSSAPVNITNKIGTILLRKGDLATPLVLASGFDILLGRIEVTVPWVIPDSDYSVVRALLLPLSLVFVWSLTSRTVFGDSGNFSPEFTINGPAVFQ
ncbi:hypothetical protein VTO73DRAFT_10204 [Trametes versicolor]